jgi:thiol-disulfide isomerase/thioredoxin
MKKNVRILLAALIVSLCMGGLTACGKTDSGQLESGKSLKEGDVAPDFTAKLVDGTEFKMSDHNNEVVILNFFASWCGPCMNEMPAFEMLKNDGYSNLSILCVNCMEDKNTVDLLVKTMGYTFPIAYDEAGDIEKFYPTDGIPYTLVIKEGIIKNIFLGAVDAETQHAEYKKAIDACME